MMRVLVVTLPEKGHVHPLLGPAQELARRGADVAIASPCDIAAELAIASQCRVLIPPGAPPPPAGLRGEALSRVVADPAELRRWIRELLVEAPARNVDAMRSLVRDFRPDVVAIDTMAYDAAIAAELEEVPWVGWATSLGPVVPAELDSELLRTLRSLDADRQALFAAHGLTASFRSSDVLSPHATAVFATEALVGEPPNKVFLVGPSRRKVPASAFDPSFAAGRPLVYASFGSQAWHQPHRFNVIIEAALKADVALLAAMGDMVEQFAALPPSVRCVRFAPQLDVLAHARVAITHGGANSVMEGLAAGVPLLISPICNDQPHNLFFAARTHAAVGIDLDRCGCDELVDALRALCADGPHRAAARQIAASYALADGASGAADIAQRAARPARS